MGIDFAISRAAVPFLFHFQNLPIMRIILSIVLSISSLSFIPPIYLHEWNDCHYNVYDYESFKELKVINQVINPNNIDYDLLNAAIFYFTNEQRAIHDLPLFKHSPNLEKAAQGHSDDMVNHNFYSHYSTVEGKHKMSERLEIVGIQNAYCAENIYDFFENDPTYSSLAFNLVEGWMHSSGHRANILNENLTHLGCGSCYYYDEVFTETFHVKATQNFSSKYGGR